MKQFNDMIDIEDVGETLVRCFVGENKLTESSANLLISKAVLLVESDVPPSSTVSYLFRHKYNIRLREFITAYVEVDEYNTAVRFLEELGVPREEWDGKGDAEASARSGIGTLIKWARGHDEGAKWIFPKWGDRIKYSKSAVKSIHPSKVGYIGITATPSDGRDYEPSMEWDERDMVDTGYHSKNQRSRSNRIIDSFNKSEIALGEFYSNLSRIRPSVWGRFWNREKTSVQSDKTLFGRKWKKIFVLGYQIDRALLYEVWYSTIDSMFTVHDKLGNQISRKFPTLSEATKALTNAIVQSDTHDSKIFAHGGGRPNQIAASIVKALNSDSDSMIDDLMKIEDREIAKRSEIEARAMKKRMDSDQKWEDNKKKLKQYARNPMKTPIAVGLSDGILSFSIGAFDAMVRTGEISKNIATIVSKTIGSSVKLTVKHIDTIADAIQRAHNHNIPNEERWRKDVKAGKMEMSEYLRRVSAEIEANMRVNTVDYGTLREKPAYQQNNPTVDGNDSDKREEEILYRQTSMKKRSGFVGKTMEQAIDAIKAENAISQPYANAVNGNKEKIRNYISMLLNTKRYARNRTKKEEIILITWDTYGRGEMLGTVSSMVKKLTQDGKIIRENYRFDDEMADAQHFFDIDDELDSRRDSTVNTLRRNSAKVAMTISDLKDAINNDLVELYSETRVDESKWKGTLSRLLNKGRKVPISLPTDKPTIKQRVMMFFQGTRYRADFVTGVTLTNRINVEVWYVTEPNPNANIFDLNGVVDAEYHGRPTISSFYVFDVTAGTLIRRYLPYHKNALQVAMAKLGAL